MNNSRFFGVFLFVLFILLGAAMMVSYFEDPAGIFRNGYEQGMVEIITSGKNVANVENFNERIFEKYLISQYTKKVDTAVIGSSRIMQIGDSVLNENVTILNNGLSGATVEDEIAIIWMYYNKGYLPDQIIIGVDPWIFNKNNGQTRWESIKEEYFHGLEMLGLHTKNESLFRIFEIDMQYQKIISLISRDILFASLKKITEGKNTTFFPTDEDKLDVGIRLTDGTIGYPEKTTSRPDLEVRKMAQDYISNGQVYSLNSFGEIDEENINKFLRLIEFLQDNHVRITFIFPPYHPIVYDEMKRNPQYRNVLIAEKIMKDLGKEKNISIVGSYNPSDLNFTSYDFSDGMHLNSLGVYKLLSHPLSDT